MDDAVLLPPNAHCVLVLAHGAGAGLHHAHMASLAEAFAAVGVATYRFNFPYMQAGRRRVDAQAVAVETVALAVERVLADTDLPVFAGGHSFGGRMTSHAAAEGRISPQGLVYCSFPLHPAKKPDVKRAAHLQAVTQPQLFLSGTRDDLAERGLLEGVVSGLPHAPLCWLEHADHSFKVRKRDQLPGAPGAYQQAADAVLAFSR